MAVIVRSAHPSSVWRDFHPVRPVVLLWSKRRLLRQLITRDLRGRYRGSLLGSLWTVLLPVLAVVVYTLVFGGILKQKWPTQHGSGWGFALILFAGLALFNAFAEVVQRATSVIPSQPNLVKKVVFPLEILPATLLGVALVPLVVSLLVVGTGILCTGQLPRLGWIALGLIPFLIWLQGLAWLLAAVGTYLRDLAPMVAALCPLMLFMTPLFYPVALVPGSYHWLVWLNPLAVAVEAVRAGLTGTPEPPVGAMFWLVTISVLTWQFGFWTFARLRPEMADVV